MASALSRITLAMMAVHEKGCGIQDGQHRWANCSATPTVWGVADALDALDGGDGRLIRLALALHDRECRDTACVNQSRRYGHAREGWLEQAETILAHEVSRLF